MNYYRANINLGILKLMIFSPNTFKKVFKVSFGHNSSNIANSPVKTPAFLWQESSLEVMLGKAFSSPCLISSPLSFPRMPSITGIIPPIILFSHKFHRLSASFSELAHHTRPESLSCSLRHLSSTGLESLLCLGCLGSPELERMFFLLSPFPWLACPWIQRLP